ncbi:hypothetical protein GCM10020229_38000 [Kitasatospora albolonga]
MAAGPSPSPASPRASLPPQVGPILLDVSCEPYDRATLWAPLTPEEARQLAGLLLQQATAAENPSAGHAYDQSEQHRR